MYLKLVLTWAFTTWNELSSEEQLINCFVMFELSIEYIEQEKVIYTTLSKPVCLWLKTVSQELKSAEIENEC